VKEDTITKKYKPIVKKVADKILRNAKRNFSPNQLHSELKKDIEQDVWIEVYSLLMKVPKIDRGQVEEQLNRQAFPISSLPEERIIYTDNIDKYMEEAI
jgi:hypothetical protein